MEGTTPLAGIQPERLILDGQQRLTSLFQSLTSGKPVETQDVRKHAISGWFYMDMRKALNPNVDREDAILFLPVDRIQRNFRGDVTADCSTAEKEYESCLFPLAKAFDPDDWYMGFQEHWDYDKEKSKFWNSFNRDVLSQFDRYQLPVIELSRDTPRNAVCQVFEKVNTGGVTLTVFELLTATFAADEFDLRQHWEKECRASWAGPEYRILREVANTDFLQAVTLLATADRRETAAASGEDDERLPRIGCKRDDMLKLTLAEYQRFAPAIVNGMRTTARFLHGQHLFDTKYLPYGSQLIPLAAIFASLGKDAEVFGAQQKLARWYWCGVFGELYGGTTETRFSQGPPRGRELDTCWRTAAAHRGGGAVRPRSPDDPANPRERSVQRHLRPRAQRGRYRLAHRGSGGHEPLLRRGYRHPSHLPEGLVREAEDQAVRVQLGREQDPADGPH